MAQFFSENLGTIIVALIIALIIMVIIVRMIKNKKSGKSGCGSCCSSCPSAGICQVIPEQEVSEKDLDNKSNDQNK